MSGYSFLGEREARPDGGWRRAVRVGETDYRCLVERGQKVRIAFKPRGPQAYGFRWRGSVWVIGEGRCVWTDDVAGTIGCKGLLQAAGLLAGRKRAWP